MPNELRIQNGLFLDNFIPSANASAPNFLLVNSNGLVSYFPTGSLTIPTAAASSFPMDSNGAGDQNSIWSTGPLANVVNKSATSSILIGYEAGNANTATGNISIGYRAFKINTDNNDYNIAIGHEAGSNVVGSATKGSYSTFIGYRAGINNALNGKNIIIGTNITLPANAEASLNIGGVLFGTGLYKTEGSAPFSGSQSPTVGMIGIGTNNPSTTLHVSGTVTITGTSSSFVAPAPPNTQLTNATAKSFTLGLEPKMMGYAASIIPRKSGTLYVSIVGTYALSNDGAYMRLQGRFGTGSAPAFESFTSGSGIGIIISGSVPRSNVPVPFNVHGLVSGLTLGTTYWIDLQARQTTGDGIIDDVTIVAFEL
jgi:hypothetical protein